MRIRLLLPIVVCAALAAGPAAAVYAQSAPSDEPLDCQAPNVICDDGFGSDGGGGIPGAFIVFGALVVMVGIGATIWRVSLARQMASDAGLDPDRAGAVAFLTKDGVDAAYIASSLRASQPSAPPAASPGERASDRLHELAKLRDEGLVTPAEYEARRQAIIDSV